MPAVQDVNPPNLWAWFDINDVQVTRYAYISRWKCEQANSGISKNPITGRMTIKGDDHVAEYKFFFGDDIEMVLPGGGIIMTSPNGTRFIISVDNSGNLISS